MHEDDDESYGYKKTPKHTRFQKGVTGNPKGRPRKKSAGNILTPFVPIRIGGKLVQVPRTEAALFLLLSKGLQERDTAALNLFLHHWHGAQPEKPKQETRFRFVRNISDSRDICDELFEILAILHPVPPKRPTRGNIQWLGLEIWMLEEALKRYKGKSFSEEEIAKIAEDTVDPARAREILLIHSRGKIRKIHSQRKSTSNGSAA